MQILKDLVEQARQESKTQGELTEGSGRSTYEFGDATGENQYPNADRYSASNTDVGKEVPNTRTVGIIGEDQIASGAKKVSTGIQSISEMLDITDPILKNYIFNSDFVFNQTKLRSLNKLSGKVFNPVGIISTIASEDNNSIALQTVKQAISDIVGGGAYETTDGKTFYSALDTDAQSEIFTAQGFKNSTRGSSGIADAFLNNLLSTAGQAIGLKIPSRSILAQVVSYDKSLYDSFDDETYNWFTDGTGDDPYQDGTTINIDPIGTNAINYIYDTDLLAKDPVKYYETRRKIRNGLLAQNVLTPKSDDIIEAEVQANTKSKKVLNQILHFVEDRIFDGVTQPNDFYKHGKEQFKPDEDNLFDQIIEHMYGDFVKDSDLNRNTVSGAFLQRVFDDFYRGKEDGQYDSVKTRENDRLEKLKEYGSSMENPTDDQKLDPLRQRDDYVDERNHPDGYRHHNIAVNLGSSLRDRISEKTFSEYRRVLEDNNINVDDEIMGSDITQLADTEHLGNEFDTNKFMAIEDIRTDKVIYLRPTFENISEDIQINNADFFYIGRTEPFPNYENTTRAITLSFKLYADTPNEFLLMWKKMDFLNGLAYPEMTSAKDIKNPILRFTIGNLFKRIGGYLNTLNYSYSNQDTTWETEKGKLAPKIVDVSMSFTVLHDKMPYVHKNNEFNFDKSEGSNQFNFYDVDYSELNE